MSGMVCTHCGGPVDPDPYAGWLHRSPEDSALCEWLAGRREDDDPEVRAQLEWLP